MPEISIIVPVYNVQPYLRACMGSLVGQTFCDIEIICVDDGSANDSLSILEEYAVTDIGQFLRRDGESANSQPASDMDISSFAHGSMNMTEDFAKQCAAVMPSVVDSVDAVITDRLHVGIASVLMGKEFYLMDNTYGKLSAVFEHSLSGKPWVHFVDAPPSHINPKHTVSDNLSRLLRVTQ